MIPRNDIVVHTTDDLFDFEADLLTHEKKSSTIACVIPAHQEEDSIQGVLYALIHQTRMPDSIFVIVNGCDDETLPIAKTFEGRHDRIVKGVPQSTTVYVHDMGDNPEKKVGALNRGWLFAKDFDFIFGVDGDTVVDRFCLEKLEAELESDSRIGGISAIYTIPYDQAKGPLSTLLVAGQRANFASFNLDNLLTRGRKMAVLGGQASLFRTDALKAVIKHFKQQTPYVTDSCVEDSLLSLQLKTTGYSTKISATARANVGGMTTLSSLFSQQQKWIFGAMELQKQWPMHPNLRLRWLEVVSMTFNIITRLGFMILLIASLSIGAFVFSPYWLIPSVISVLLNLKIAATMKNKNWKDIAYAAFFIPSEIYMWLRISHFLSSVAKILSKSETDMWAAQSNAEQGKANGSWFYPLIVVAGVIAGTVYMWSTQSDQTRSVILWFGWLGLYVLTLSQSVMMVKKFLRRTRGFKA